MSPRITVIGTGYLGATHAACMAELGIETLGVDVDRRRIALLQGGRAPFHEPGLGELIERHVASGRLRFTASYEEAAEFGDVHFLCVGTPQGPDGLATDLRYLDAAVASLAPHLRRPCLVVGKSTVPIGTAGRLVERISRLAPVGGEAELAWNPEFLREGRAVQDTLNPDRLVIGTQSPGAEEVLRAVYRSLLDTARLDGGVPLVVTDLATAELVKAAANTFLATKISFINAIAEICESSGADVRTLAEALALDPRINHQGMVPGLGYGGGCLPKDLRGFVARAEELGMGRAVAFLHEVDAINSRRRERTVDLAREMCGGSLAGQRIAVWGAAFKPDTDDIRDSPALAVAAALAQSQARVTVHDPMAVENARKAHPELAYAEDPIAACEGASVLLHLTEWSDYQKVDPVQVRERMATPRVIDGRCALSPSHWRSAGWTYRALGSP